MLVLACLFASIMFQTQPVRASCSGCNSGEVRIAKDWLEDAHEKGTAFINKHTNKEFKKQQEYLVVTAYGQYIMPALQAFSKQMTSIAMQQLTMIGAFFDAKQQLETQLLYQELQVQAHKDYQPSADFCYFGTNVRSLAASEQISNFNALALNARQMKRHLGTGTVGSDPSEDKASRWKQFKTTYCDVRDNAWPLEDGETDYKKTGLYAACDSGPADKTHINNDIDYTRLIDQPRTIDVAFYQEKPAPTPAEEDVMALGNNLFGHDIQSRFTDISLGNLENQKVYMGLRSIQAKRNVAENSFNAIVGLKSSGSKADPNASSQPETRKFLAAVMKELGVPEDEIYGLIGDDPSYYAQLEILAKKIYQTPNFFADLYDKPANVERKGVALKAIELMLDRAIYESQIRQEMVTSVLLSSKIEPELVPLSKTMGSQ